MVSLLNGPIPSDPCFDKPPYYSVPATKIRPEARNIALKAEGTVGMLLNIEGLSLNRGSSKPKAQPKDHVKENVKRMRQIQRQVRVKEETARQPVRALWKSDKYEGIQSKVYEQIKKEPAAPRPHSAHFLRAHSRTGYQESKPARPASVEPPEDKLTVPRAETARDVKLVRKNIDFIKANGRSVKYCTVKRSPSLTALDELKKKKEEEETAYKKGVVPKYLEKRKDEWKREEEERIANMPDPDLPPGHRLLSEADRRSTLVKLKETEVELNNQLACLPVRNDTLTIRRKREELERKISEVEEAIKIFSRSKVFVKLDS